MHRLLMPSKSPAELEFHVTLLARVRLFAGVNAFVAPEMADSGEHGTAVVASIAPYSRMNEGM